MLPSVLAETNLNLGPLFHMPQENEAPRKRKLSLSKDSRRQLSLKSFLKPSSAVVADVQSL